MPVSACVYDRLSVSDSLSVSVCPLTLCLSLSLPLSLSLCQFDWVLHLLPSHRVQCVVSDCTSHCPQVSHREASVAPRVQDTHTMGVLTSAWDYMRQLMQLAGVERDEYRRWSARMDVVEQIYLDR